jgi:hypothetical protein
MSHSHHRRGFNWALWGAPILLAVLSIVGLLSALVGDGPWDAVSWIGLGIPCLVCLWYGLPWRKNVAR